MNADQREAVRSNARYLRRVRPIDPGEIDEYVEGQPHPAAVAQVLREEATDLGLVEREDGTFVPVEEGPVAVEFDGVGAFPERYGRALEDHLVDAYGPGWPDGESGDALRERIRALKDDYLHRREVEYDRETALAYAVYHLPDYYAAVQYVLADLAAEGLVPHQCRVLDVGAGVGGPALGLHDLFSGDALVDYHAVEPGDAADVLASMLEAAGRNFHATVHRTTAEAFDPEGSFDLILFANVLSELSAPVETVRRYAGWLSEEGSVVALAPADRNTAVGLRAVERAVADSGPLTVYAPTVRLWPGEAPTDEMWSFDVRPDLAVPGFQRRLADATEGDGSAFVNVDVQYAFGVFRTDGRRRIDVRLDPSTAAKFADSESHVTDRVDCFAVKLSHDLADGGNPLYRIGDASQSVGHFAVLAEESTLNADLATAGYGDPLAFENVLVLWNDDEGAYNLVVDGETVIDRLPA
jgi:2-polyprenyl-3-methyl-5-hydroxy-6-metoxy-1,4-benzoquinol methylase